MSHQQLLQLRNGLVGLTLVEQYGRRSGSRTRAPTAGRAPVLFGLALTNPPFGGKEGKGAQTHFAYKTGATQVLLLWHVMESLADNGRCGIVLDEGVLFRTNETAFLQTKRKLLDEFDLWCIVSLPPGTFINAGAGMKTNLLLFSKQPSPSNVGPFLSPNLGLAGHDSVVAA